MKLRPYETEWLDKIKASKSRRVLVVGPTGAGKTVVAAALINEAADRGERVLFVGHRRELVKQAVMRLHDSGIPKHAIGVTLGSYTAKERKEFAPRPDAPVQVSSIQSLCSRQTPVADLVVIDEAHRVAAKSYRKLVAAYPNAMVYGLTATPYRLDGKPLSDVFDDLVQSAQPSQLIADGWLSRPLVFTVPEESRADLSSVPIYGRDFHQDKLAEAVNKRHLVGSIVDHWKRHAAGRPTVCYSVNVEHGKHITATFVSHGVRAELIHGATPVAKRVKALSQLATGEIQVLVNCMVLVEGWDCPEAKLAIVARPTMSTGLWMQMAGRITRPYKGAPVPVILDHAGNALIHGLPLEDVEFRLDFEVKRRAKAGVAPEKTCPECGAACLVGQRVCSFCGHEHWPEGEIPSETQELLVVARQGGLQCAWEKCPKPHVPVSISENRLLHMRRSVDVEIIHASCRSQRSEDARFCKYEQCPTPEKLLGKKARTRGSTMHRGCAQKARTKETRRPGRETKRTCSTCGSEIKNRCRSCSMKKAWSRPEYQQKMGQRALERRRRCQSCGDLLRPNKESRFHPECWLALTPDEKRAHRRRPPTDTGV